MKKLLILAIVLLSLGCSDYTIYAEPRVEYEEVPVYIEVEVLVPGDLGDAEIWVDHFYQPNLTDGVDILWAIDDSCSMSNDTPLLMAGIGAMMGALPASGWRLNMTLITVGPAMAVAQFPLVPGDDEADAINMYNNLLFGGWEAGFDSVMAYIDQNPYASTWMRPSASLLVVFVSDEDDSSQINTQEFLDWYTSLRQTVYLASIVNLVKADSLCNTSNYMAGNKYIEATDALEGIVIDICSEDWSAGVEDASTQIIPHEEWTLSRIPVASTIKVFVDGIVWEDWTWDEPTNTVYFDVVPDGGALVEIGYILDPDLN